MCTFVSLGLVDIWFGWGWLKRNTSPAFEWSGRWKLLWCWPGFGLALLLNFHVIRLFDQKKIFVFLFLKGQGCVESKNKTSAKRKSTMSSLDPSIIQVDSFKCRADVPLSWIFISFLLEVLPPCPFWDNETRFGSSISWPLWIVETFYNIVWIVPDMLYQM